MLGKIFFSLFSVLNKNRQRSFSNYVRYESHNHLQYSLNNFGIEKKNALTEHELKKEIQKLPSFDVLEVVDGDTVILRMNSLNVTVRLDSIDCPEGGQKWGDNAKYGLIKLIGGKKVKLEYHDHDDYGRLVATLFVHSVKPKNYEWMNVNERMVTLGHAWVMRKYYNHLPQDRKNKLNSLEKWAKSKNIGLWSLPNPIPPWVYRQMLRDETFDV